MHQPATLQCEILTSRGRIDALGEEWQRLHQRLGAWIFGDYEGFVLWWRTFAENRNFTPYIAVARRASGDLSGVLPLVIRRRGPVRILEWAGQNVYDFIDVLAESETTAQTLWAFVLNQKDFDVAVLKDVREGSLSLPILKAAMRLRRRPKEYFLELDYTSGEQWYSTLSRKRRSDMKRKLDKMASRGAVAFHAYCPGNAVPARVIDALCAHKRERAEKHHIDSAFLRPEMRDFLQDLAQKAAQDNMLYLAWLTCGDAIAAVHLGFVFQQNLLLYNLGYDNAFGVYSPGNTMMAHTIQWAIGRGLRELDFLRGEDLYKTYFASGNLDNYDFIAGHSMLGKIVVRLH